MSVHPMSPDDLERVLRWAASEGWNPGLQDAEAFYAADPAGFFIKKLADRPIAAISVVNHDEAFAFLGLYICHPDYRGNGYGYETWAAGLAHAGQRCIGLDGVPDQQANYAKSGFVGQGQTTRYAGTLPRAETPNARLATPEDLPHLLAQDARATGIQRTAFATTWFETTRTRQTLILPDDGAGPAFATFRKCRDGLKIGPFYAPSQQQAIALLAAAPVHFGEGDAVIDVPSGSPDLLALVNDLCFEATFQTARMYKGPPPPADPPPFYGIATMELG